MNLKKLVINIDGASRGNPGPAGIGVVFKGADNFHKEMSLYIGEATNNVAEYKALLCALSTAWDLKCSHLTINTDSELLVKQFSGEYKIKSDNIRPLYTEAKKMLARFSHLELKHVMREENKAADRLAAQAIEDMHDKKSRRDGRSVVFYHGEESPSSIEQRSG